MTCFAKTIGMVSVGLSFIITECHGLTGALELLQERL